MTALRNRADVVPVAHAAATCVLQWTAFAALDGSAFRWPACLVVCALAFYTVPITHNHFHSRTFRVRAWNAALEHMLFLANGFSTRTWGVTHRLHHKNYLRQGGLPESRDPNAWQDDAGRTRSVLSYCVCFVAAHWLPGPRGGRRRGARGTIGTTLRLASVTALVLLDAESALLFFVAPMAVSQALTAVHSFHQHAGLPTDDPYAASYNYVGPWFLYNIGYHTAHHVRPGLHWSRLPEFHARIEHRIPQANSGTSYLATPARGRAMEAAPEAK